MDKLFENGLDLIKLDQEELLFRKLDAITRQVIYVEYMNYYADKIISGEKINLNDYEEFNNCYFVEDLYRMSCTNAIYNLFRTFEYDSKIKELRELAKLIKNNEISFKEFEDIKMFINITRRDSNFTMKFNLHVISKINDLDKYLLKLKIDPNHVNFGDNSYMIQYLIEQGKFELAQKLVDIGAKVFDENRQLLKGNGGKTIMNFLPTYTTDVTFHLIKVNDFIVRTSKVNKEKLKKLMMETDELLNDMGTILIGKEAVDIGLIDEVGGIKAALDKLESMIE